MRLWARAFGRLVPIDRFDIMAMAVCAIVIMFVGLSGWLAVAAWVAAVAAVYKVSRLLRKRRREVRGHALARMVEARARARRKKRRGR